MSMRHWPDGSDPLAIDLRNALDDAQLRGPNDVALRRGWAAFSGRMAVNRTRRWVWFASGVGSTAALAVACALWLWPGKRVDVQATVAATPAVVTDRAAPAAPEAPTVPPAVPAGQRLMMLEGGVEAQLSSTAVIRIVAGAPHIDGGEVRFSVPKQAPGHQFVVHAAGYRVIVVGTRFGVAVRGAASDKQQVDVDVSEGVVEVWEQARLARLAAGERWNSQEAPQAVDSESGAGEKDEAGPVVSSRPARRSKGASRSLAMTSPDGSLDNPAKMSEAAAADLTGAARTALAAGDPARALQIYKVLAQRTGPGAENAAYEMGKILSERLGQPGNAVATWRRYRSDHPDGILRLEADVSIIETLARSGESEAALVEATEFLRRHPDSERRPEVARLTGDLYRVRGDCRRAVGAYQITLATRRPNADAEVASYQRAVCLNRLGDAGAAEAARGYVRSYPNGRFRKEAAALAGTGAQALPTDGRTSRP